MAAAPAIAAPGLPGPTGPEERAVEPAAETLPSDGLPPPPPPPDDAPTPAAAPALVVAPPAPAPPPAATAPSPEVAPPAASASAGRALAPATVQVTMARQKAAFDRCVEIARAEPGGEALEGRKIALLVAVGNSGRVEASEVEEPDVEASALGACLRRVAGRLLFPPFEGETLGLRIPLQLGGPATSPAPP